MPHQVLVVDDDPDVLLLCRVTLTFEGYEVTEAANGEQGLRRLREQRPDVVLLDVMLARSGQVLEEIRADPRLAEIPVVMLTTKVEDHDQILGWAQVGAAESITKPFSPRSLAQVLEDVLATDPEQESRRRALVRQRLRP